MSGIRYVVARRCTNEGVRTKVCGVIDELGAEAPARRPR